MYGIHFIMYILSSLHFIMVWKSSWKGWKSFNIHSKSVLMPLKVTVYCCGQLASPFLFKDKDTAPTSQICSYPNSTSPSTQPLPQLASYSSTLSTANSPTYSLICGITRICGIYGFKCLRREDMKECDIWVKDRGTHRGDKMGEKTELWNRVQERERVGEMERSKTVLCIYIAFMWHAE